MPAVRRFDHVGITVADLDAATAFFVGLGLEVEGRTFVEGEFIDVVTGLPDSRSEIVMLRPPGGGTGLELARFVRPDHAGGSPDAMANELGLRNVGFEVDDLPAILDRLAADGYGLVGGMGEYEGTYLTIHTALGILGDRDPWREAMPDPQQLPADLIEEGTAIPVARVQAMHEGKRRARAARASAAE